MERADGQTALAAQPEAAGEERPVDLAQVIAALHATVVEGSGPPWPTVEHVYASDLMSDLLAFGKPHSLLLTGLASRQAVISAHMAEFRAVCLIRGKCVSEASRTFARDHDMVLLKTELDMYEACARVDATRRRGAGSEPLPTAESQPEELSLRQEFPVVGRDFANAGTASTGVKSVLKKIGFDPQLVRRVAIATYEGEMNVVMHARRGTVALAVSSQSIEVVIRDEGKGIPDIEQAMQEGFTTSTEEMRAMGFGSGMGLPNMKRNADRLDVSSEVGVGTTVRMTFNV